MVVEGVALAALIVAEMTGAVIVFEFAYVLGKVGVTLMPTMYSASFVAAVTRASWLATDVQSRLVGDCAAIGLACLSGLGCLIGVYKIVTRKRKKGDA